MLRESGMDALEFRAARDSDADGIGAVLKALAAAGKRSRPSDSEFALAHYIGAPHQVRCTVAVDPDGEILGFQSLKLAIPNNPYGVAVGWGIIGTHIHPLAARRGIGRALFRSTLQAARTAGLPAIDATIGATNAEGRAYYKAMGFRDYRHSEGAVHKSFPVTP